MLVVHAAILPPHLPRGAVVRRLDPAAAEGVYPTVLGTIEPPGFGSGVGRGVGPADGAVVSHLARIRVRVRVRVRAVRMARVLGCAPWLC